MRKPSALIVDDEEPMRLLCRVNLVGAGFRVVEAADGPEAIIAATREPPDLLVVDLMMPGMDGWAVLAALKTAFADDPVPAIILSASVSPANEQRASAEGARFLGKPFDVTQFVDLARHLTHGRREQQLG